MKLKYTFVFSIISFFITTAGFSQELSDREIGFDMVRTTASLKEHGVEDQDLAREIGMMREMQMHQHMGMKKVEDEILQNIKTRQRAKASTSRLTVAVDIPATERAALIALYRSTYGDYWGNHTGWDINDPNSDVSTWYGVTVYNGSVISLNLGYNSLNGYIPEEIGQLSNLESIYLHNNNLSGSIPSQMGQLTKLKILYLPHNSLEGSLPFEIGQLSNLESIVLYSNKLTGEIPPQIGQLSKLQILHLTSNKFSGFIPAEIGQLSKLTFLDFSYNMLGGTIPPEFGQLSNLEYLNINDNQLVGSIPPQIGQLSKLKSIRLPRNRLEGSIPPELGQLSNLSNLELSSNQLTGVIPQQIAQLNNLYSFYIYDNKFEGLIPDFTNLNFLYQFGFIGNRFRFIDFASQYSIYKSKILYFNYSRQAKTDVEKSITSVTGGAVTLTMCEDGRFVQNVDTFQWYKGISPNGVLIDGANSREYTISNLITSNSGKYYCLSKNPQITNSISDAQNLILERNPITLKVINCTSVAGTLKVSTESPSVNVSTDFSLETTTTNLTYKWTFYNLDNTEKATATTEQASQSYSVAGTYKVNLVVTEANGCTTSFDKTITLTEPCVSIAGTVKASTESPTVNANTDFSFETAATNLTYKWTFYALDTITEKATATTAMTSQSYSVAGTYKVNLVVTEANGCTTSFDKTVTVTQPCVSIAGTIKASTESPAVNANTDFSLETAATGLTYKWTFYNLDNTEKATATTAIASQSYSVAETYKVNLVVTEANGCTTSFDKTITVTEPCVSIAGTVKTSTESPIVNVNTNFSFETTATNLTYDWSVTNSAGVIINTTSNTTGLYAFITNSPGDYVVKLKATNENKCETEFLKTITIKDPLPIVDCETHFNFNFKIPSTVKGGILNNTEREHIANGIINFVNRNINEKLYLTTYDDHSTGVRTVALQNKYTVVFPDATTNTSNETQGGFFRIQDDFYSDTFKNIITNVPTGIISNTGITKKIDVSFFVISEDNYADIVASKTAYADLLNSAKSNKIFFIFLDEGRFRNRTLNTYISPIEFASQLKGTAAINYATTGNIITSDFVSFSKAQIADEGFKNVLSAFLDKSYTQVKAKKCTTVNCVSIVGTIKASTESPTVNANTDFSLETTATNLTYKWTFYNLDNTEKATATTAHASQSYGVAGTYKVNLVVTEANGCTTSFDKTVIVKEPCVSVEGIVKASPEVLNANVNATFSLETTATSLTYDWTFCNLDSTPKATATTAIATQSYDAAGRYRVTLIVKDEKGCTTPFETFVTVLPACTPITGVIKIGNAACQANVLATPSSQNISSGQTTNIGLTSSTAGTTFTWTVNEAGLTGATAGSGNSIVQVLTNTGSTMGTVTYMITPKFANCSGTPIKVIVNVSGISEILGNCYSMTLDNATYRSIPVNLKIRYTQYNGGVVNVLLTNLQTMDNLDGSYTLTLCSSTPPIFNQGAVDVVWGNYFTQTGTNCTYDGDCGSAQ